MAARPANHEVQPRIRFRSSQFQRAMLKTLQTLLRRIKARDSTELPCHFQFILHF